MPTPAKYALQASCSVHVCKGGDACCVGVFELPQGGGTRDQARQLPKLRFEMSADAAHQMEVFGQWRNMIKNAAATWSNDAEDH